MTVITKLDSNIEDELVHHIESEIEYLENAHYQIIDNGLKISIEGTCHITEVNKLLEDIPYLEKLLNADYESFNALSGVNQIIFKFK